jgi:pimeloyl-ACP methyl ester carboxylesterase
MHRVASLVAVAAAFAAATAATAAPTQHVAVSTTCFSAAGPDGKPIAIFGRRFTVGKPTAKTPAIILVHGVATNADYWDITRSQSVARRLARAGYVVIAYDRPGYRYSRYTGAGGGDALTVSANQAVLHDLIQQVHRGTYRVRAYGTTCDRLVGKRTAYRTRRVAIIGHSGGGFIASTYPARYHDVVAMVQADAPSGVTAKDGNAAILSSTAPPAHGAMDDQFGVIGDSSRDDITRPAPAGYYYPNPDRAACEEFNFWRTGTVRTAATRLCNPVFFDPIPNGETGSYVAQAIENNSLITKTGNIPVLLAGADHDGIMPGDANKLELEAWQQHCGCRVSQFIVTNTGHAFAAHTSLPTWIHRVVTWLRGQHPKP